MVELVPVRVSVLAVFCRHGVGVMEGEESLADAFSSVAGALVGNSIMATIM